MKICFLHHTYPGIGGTETVTNLLISCFIKKGIEVSVIAWRKPSGQLSCNLDVVYMPDIKHINSADNDIFVREYLKTNNIDCLINQGPFWIPTAEIKSLRTVILSVLHYSPFFKVENQKNAIIEKYYEKSYNLDHLIKSTIRFLFKNFFAKRDFNILYKDNLEKTVINSHGFILLCPEYIREFQSLMGNEYDNLYAIENGITISDRLCNQEKEKIVVCVGRLTKWDKRIDRLLHIWRKLQNDFPDWRLQILGDGPERHNLENLAHSLGLRNYEFRGFVDIHDYLPKASVLAMTSSSEGFPMAILEGFSFGVVPIAYDVSSGISHMIVDGKTGFLVTPFNENEYVNKLKLLMVNYAKRRQMSIESILKVREFEINNIANLYLDLITGLRRRVYEI